MVCGLTARPADLNWPGGQGHHFLHLVPWAASPDVVPPRPPHAHTRQGPSEDPQSVSPTAQVLGSPCCYQGAPPGPSGLSSRPPPKKAVCSCSPPQALRKPHPKGIPPLSQVPFQQPLWWWGVCVCVCRDPRQESRPYQDQGIRANMNFKKREIVFPGDEGKETPTLSFRAFT